MKLSLSYDRLSIRNKLLVFTLIPLLAVFSFSVTSLEEKYRQYSSARQVADFAAMTAILVDLTRALQKERSFSYRYSGERSTAIKNMMTAQRKITNGVINELGIQLDERDPDHKYWGLQGEFTYLIVGLQSLQTTRTAVDVHNIDPSEYYADVNTGIHKIVQYLQVLSSDLALARRSHELITLLQMEERAWQETDVVMAVIKKGRINAGEYRAVSVFIADQETLLKNYYRVSPEDQQTFMRDRLTDPVIAEIGTLRDRVLHLMIDQATRQEQLDVLKTLIGYRKLIYQLNGDRSDGAARYAEHLSSIQHDAEQILNQLVGLPDTTAQERDVLLSVKNSFSNYAVTSQVYDPAGQQLIEAKLLNIDRQTIAWIDKLQARSADVSVEDWLLKAGERIKLFESMTLIAQNRLVLRAEEIIERAVSSLVRYVLLSVVCVFVTVYLGHLLMARFVSEILGISRSMREMSESGEFNTRLEIKGTDEIAEMAAAFNTMNADRHEAEQRHLLVKNQLLEMEKQQNNLLEQRVAERTSELGQATEKAELASRAKSRFLGNVSHHIRTPLNAMLGFSQLMAQDSSLDGEQVKRSNAIRENGQKLLNLVDEILMLVDLESGQVALLESDIDIRHLVQSVQYRFDGAASVKGLALNAEVADDLPDFIKGDEQKLDKIISLLVENAIKFTASGSISVVVRDDRGRYALVVEDTGEGIPAEQRDALTSSFEQVQEGCESELGGLGIGLAIVDKLVHVMGGELSLEDGATGGLRVVISLALTPGNGHWQNNVVSLPVVSEAQAPALPGVEIPESLIEEINQALDAADYLTLLDKAEQLRQVDPAFGDKFAELVQGYQYDALDSLISDCVS